MKGVILAAGKGTRLYPVTHHIAKPLLPMANRMTLEYAFDRLKEMGVTEIAIVVGENEPQMRETLGDGSAFGVNLAYVRQHEPKGLAHAVGFAQEFVGNDSFVMYLGDAIYSHGFAEAAQQFRERGLDQMTVLKPVEDPRRFGVANLDGDRIVKLVEKPPVPESNLAIAGLYFFGPKLWEILPELQPSARGELEITDAIQLMVNHGFDVRGYTYDHTWFDTGTLDSFLETTAFLIDGGTKVDPTATVDAELGENVVIGAGAVVKAARLEDTVVLPGARVNCTGVVRHAVLGGEVTSGDIENAIRYGEASS